MKIIHRLILNPSSIEKKKYSAFGVILEDGFQTIEVDESTANLDNILATAKAFDNPVFSYTTFTNKEKRDAAYARLSNQWLNDYPQPEDAYLEASYDLLDYCSECGIGRKQNAPLRIKKEAKWSGRKKVFGLNWIFDVLFVQKEWYEQIFKPMGLESMPVILHKKNIPAESVVQLIIPETTTQLSLEGYPVETCPKCGRMKYSPITKGFFPPLRAEVSQPIFKSVEYFGSGGSANKWILVNKELKAKLLAEKLNVDLHPLK